MALVRPLLTTNARPYWDALKARRIDVQRCDRCKRRVFYPRTMCPHCGSVKLEWQPVMGDAVLYTFTEAVVPVSEDFVFESPQLLAIAEFENGAIRIPTTLVDTDAAALRIGVPLVPVFDESTFPDLVMLRFRAATTAAD